MKETIRGIAMANHDELCDKVETLRYYLVAAATGGASSGSHELMRRDVSRIMDTSRLRPGVVRRAATGTKDRVVRVGVDRVWIGR